MRLKAAELVVRARRRALRVIPAWILLTALEARALVWLASRRRRAQASAELSVVTTPSRTAVARRLRHQSTRLVGSVGPGGSRLVGEQHLRAARASSRGVQILAVHDENARLALGAAAEITPFVFVSDPRDGLHGTWSTGYGYRIHRFIAPLRVRGVRVVVRGTGVTAALVATLRGGGCLFRVMDLQGSGRATVMGRDVWVPRGPVRDALETGALIVPVRVRQRPWRYATVTFGAPIDPLAHPDRAALQARLAAEIELGYADLAQMPAFALRWLADLEPHPREGQADAG